MKLLKNKLWKDKQLPIEFEKINVDFIAFRCFVQQHQITVYKDKVVFKIYIEDEKVKKYSYKRSKFE